MAAASPIRSPSPLKTATAVQSLVTVSPEPPTVVSPRATGQKKLIGKMRSGGDTLINSETYSVQVERPAVGTISSISPTTATLNERQNFTIRGSGFPDTVAFSIEDCDSGSVTRDSVSRATYSCIPRATGQKKLIGKMRSGGDTLINSETYSVQVERPAVGTISSISPTTATLNERQNFTIRGSGFPDTVAFSIEDCDSGSVTRDSVSRATYSCIPRATGQKKLIGKMRSGGDTLINSETYSVLISEF